MLLGNVFASAPDVTGQNCRTLIGLKKAESNVLGDSINAIRTNCQTIYTEIPGDHRVAHPEHLQKLFADEIERAWFIVHEGTVSDMWAETTFGAFGTTKEMNCFIIESITYEGKRRRDYVVDMEEFRLFLDENEAFVEEGVPWTTTQYIQSYGGTAHLALVPKNASLESINNFLKPGEVYAIAIASATESWWPGIFNAVETATYVAGGAAVAFFAFPAVATAGAVGATATAVAGASGGLIVEGAVENVNYYLSPPPAPTSLGSDENIIFFGDFEAVRELGCEEITPGEVT